MIFSRLVWCLLLAELHFSSSQPDDLIQRANVTYGKVLPCIESAWMLADKNEKRDWAFPTDAEEHYRDLLAKTEKFRTAPVHEYAHYEGPWIENIFIQQFMSKPLSYFNGFIPLFIQWIDTQILRGRHFDHIHDELKNSLRPNVLYLAISQGDVGLGYIGSSFPNILTLAAGGFGHVVIPLIRSELPWVPQPWLFSTDIGFFGNINHQRTSRPRMLEIIGKAANNLHLTFKQGHGGCDGLICGVFVF